MIIPTLYIAGLERSSQLLSELKRASTLNKAYRLSMSSPEEEELLRALDAASKSNTDIPGTTYNSHSKDNHNADCTNNDNED